MKKVLLLSTALTLGVLNPALAGGPVLITEDPEVVAAKPASSGGALIPLLLLGVIAAVILSSDDDDPVPEETKFSDIRLKQDIVRVGTTHLGLPLYHYRYRGMEGVWEGVMAQDVEIMHPGAIRAMPQGYKGVDYARLGLTLRRVH